MTVPSSINRADYATNGVTVAFAVPFRFLADSHLQVLRTITATGVSTTLALTTDYTVAGAGANAGGTITTVATYVAGSTISILRNVPDTQLTDYIANDPFPAESHERALDQLTMRNQQLAEAVARSILLAPGSTLSGLTFPAPGAGLYVRWNVAGTALETVTDLGSSGNFLQGGTGAVLRTGTAKFSEIVSPDDFGALGNGTTDDTLAMQRALDYLVTAGGGTLQFPRSRTYRTGECSVGPNTVIDLNGCTWQAIATHPATASLLYNKNNTVVGVDVVGDENIEIRNGIFKTTVAADRINGFIQIIKARNVRLRNITIDGPKYIGLLIYGSKQVWVDNCRITGTGKTAITVEGGAGIHITPASDTSTSDDIFINSTHISACEWAGIYSSGKRVTIQNCRILNVKEAGIFGTSSEQIISGGIIDGVVKKYISGSGIELGGLYASITNMEIRNAANCSVVLTDVQNATISGVRSVNARRDAASFPTAAHFVLLSQSASPNMPRDISITGNVAVDYSSPSTAAVRVEGSGAGSPITGLNIAGNNFSTTTWTVSAIYVNTTYWTQASCEFSNNLGNGDSARFVYAYLTADQSLTTAVPAALSFGAASNNAEARWAGGSPTRITALKTDKFVRFVGVGSFAANATGNRALQVYKNGTKIVGTIVGNAGATETTDLTIASGWIAVTPGDYFEMFATQRSAGALNALFGGQGCSLTAEFV